LSTPEQSFDDRSLAGAFGEQCRTLEFLDHVEDQRAGEEPREQSSIGRADDHHCGLLGGRLDRLLHVTAFDPKGSAFEPVLSGPLLEECLPALGVLGNV